MVAMADLRELVISLGHADVLTYIQSGNVLFTPPLTDGGAAGDPDTAALAAGLEGAIAGRLGLQARAVVLSGAELARCVHDNPFPAEANPRLLHAVFLPGAPAPGLAAWIAGAERQAQAAGSRDAARLAGRTVYLHTPDGYPPSELRRAFARKGGPTSPAVAGTARNWATVSRLVSLCDRDWPARGQASSVIRRQVHYLRGRRGRIGVPANGLHVNIEEREQRQRFEGLMQGLAGGRGPDADIGAPSNHAPELKQGPGGRQFLRAIGLSLDQPCPLAGREVPGNLDLHLNQVRRA
jgi:uncharacterized protein (DUF1697 family)